jgi:hypothetical protein
MGLILVVLLAVLATTVLAITVLAARNGLVLDGTTAQELTERVARQRAPMSEPYSGRQTAH